MNAKMRDRLWTGVFYGLTVFIVLILVLLIGYILVKGMGFLEPSFLFGEARFGESGGGIGPQLFNSFYMLIVALVMPGKENC